MEDESFEVWIEQLKQFFGPDGESKLIPEIWKKFFDAGMTPKQVIDKIMLE